MLLWSLGDGGGANDPEDNAQNLQSHLGKILRLDVGKEENGRKYGIPSDNPYRDTEGALPEIYAVGLRNPWRFTLDQDGTIYLGDVGQNAIEEVNVVPADKLAGANFGWPTFEGRRRTTKPDLVGVTTLIEPTLVYGHDDGECAVTGGYVYRGRVTALRGKYLYGDVCKGEVLAVEAGVRDAKPVATGLRTEQLVSFGRDGQGEFYVVSLAGYVSRISAAA
jgi:glucose/arabinose dehydrogenase